MPPGIFERTVDSSTVAGTVGHANKTPAYRTDLDWAFILPGLPLRLITDIQPDRMPGFRNASFFLAIPLQPSCILFFGRAKAIINGADTK